ncbi:branched-chain amino acid ABC transporter permease [Thauera sinica]|uniref:Branched-chain amino acid ABC transporter permease n=1 Tax=Thauera sinica TaxID=2665146 RepID=A0ABW1AMU2_9RHOO|nr:branched-chain amino acid ABC transporter permease [Thauera sp. K11]ATE61651.1 branched-chain amino acid ABC transporter permease [Thauera sp. K11]
MTNTKFAVERSTPLSRAALGTGTALVVLGATLPFWGGDDTLVTLVEFLYFLALAQMWNLLAGYGGLISIGQQAFVGLGAYAMVALTLFAGINPFIAVPLAGIAAGLAAWPSARALFRLQGPYFAVGSWVLAEILRLVFSNFTVLGGGSGISITSAVMDVDPWWRGALSYWLALAVGAGSVAAVHVLLRSKRGMALTAVRDSETASESIGISVGRIKLQVYIASAIGTGIIGALIFLTKLRVSPDAAFSMEWSALVIFIVIIGGVGTIEGPLLGTILYFVLRSFMADYGAWYMILLGAIAVLTMLFMRRGIWGWLAARYGLQLFPVQRRLRRDSPPSAAASISLGTSPASNL